MEIKNLADTDLETIVACMSSAFQNYFVKIPFDVHFWKARYHAARVDFSLSFGVFDNGKLIAFIINGIDYHNKMKTAFNTGTGVLEDYRGQKLVDQIYDYAIPILKENGVQKCLLEVIEQNHKAVRVYSRIGFEKIRFLKCYKGELAISDSPAGYQEIDIQDLSEAIMKYQPLYSWDNTMEAILTGGKMFKAYVVYKKNNTQLGYFVLNDKSKSLVQIEAFQKENWPVLLSTLNELTTAIRINNVDDKHSDCIAALESAGIPNHINQFEMSLIL